MLSIEVIYKMILAAHLCGDMLQQQGLLRPREEIMCMTPASRRFLLQNLADQRANLTPRQRRKLIQHRFRAVLCARLFGKQSWQDYPMKIQVHVLRHLMTMGIPRNMIVIPLSILQKPHWPYFSFSDPDSSFFHPDGFEYNSRTGWTHSFSCGFVHMTTHPSKPFIAITGSDGRVWIKQIGDKTNSFYLMHALKSKEDVCATTCAFHPSENYVAVGVPGRVLVYEFSSSSLFIKCKMVIEIKFFEDPGYFCTRPPQYAPCEIQWHPTGESFTAVSGRNGNLSRKFILDRKTFQATSELTHAYLFNFDKGHIAPLCSCTSPDGTSVATGYSGGKFFINNSKLDPKSLTVQSVLPADCSIKRVEYNPLDPKILVALSSSRDCDGVYLLKISPDGHTITILHSFLDAMDFQFYDGMFLLLNGNTITFFRLNSDNLPVKMTEFKSTVGRIGSFCFTTLNEVVTLWYSSHSNSNLYKAEIRCE